MHVTNGIFPDDQYEIDRTTERLSLFLGWFSIALGTAELLAPRQVARLIGIRPERRTRSVLRSFGARELAAGFGILSQPDEAKWLWSRVGGDAMDLASLRWLADSPNTDRNRLALAGAAVAAVTALDVLVAQRLAQKSEQTQDEFAPDQEVAMTVNAPIERVESAWVEWCAQGDAPSVRKSYAVRLEQAPGARGTELHVAGGSKGKIREDLRHFKQWLETGEIPASEGPSLWRSAQPPARRAEISTAMGVRP